MFQIDKAFHASLPKVHIRIFFGLQQNVYHWKICAVSKMSWISQLQKPWMQVIEKCTAKPIPGGNEEIRWKRRFLHSFSPWKVLTPQKCWITKKILFQISALNPIIAGKLKPNGIQNVWREVNWLGSSLIRQMQPKPTLHQTLATNKYLIRNTLLAFYLYGWNSCH